MTTRPATRAPSGYVLPDGSVDAEHGAGNLTGRRLSRGAAIRKFCLSCQGSTFDPWLDVDGNVQPAEAHYADVRECPTVTCFLHPFREGRDPYRKPAHRNTTGLKRVVRPVTNDDSGPRTPRELERDSVAAPASNRAPDREATS